MFCAGLTVYAPMRRNGVRPGTKVGVMGIGGLGHYAVLFAAAMGAEVYAFTHSASKLEDAKKMGAKHVISTHDDVRLLPYLLSFVTYLTPSSNRISTSLISASSTSSSQQSTSSGQTDH